MNDPTPNRLVFGSPEANQILARDRASVQTRTRQNESRQRCLDLIRRHGSTAGAIAALRQSLKGASKSPDHHVERGEQWTDLQALLAMRKAQNRALRRAAKKAQAQP
jgi:hypothetical protein